MIAQTLRYVALVVALVFSCTAFADKLSNDDQEFLEQAAQNGLAEQSASRLAQTKAQDPRVREFAQRLIKDHEGMGAELQTLAMSKGYVPPKEPSMIQKGKEMLIANLGDKDFDRRFVNQIGVDAHQSTIRLFEEASQKAKDPDVKAFATKHLPKLREHLRIAQSLNTSVDQERASGSKR